MPRKTKESQEIEKEVKKKVAKTNKKTVASKKDTPKVEKKTIAKKDDSKDVKKAEVKKTSAKKSNQKTSTNKKITEKNANVTTAEKVSTKKASSKAVADKKVSSKTKNTRKTAVKKATPTKTSKKIDVLEYYDLPYRYNQTVVKVLAQTPTTLFIYWDISDEDRENYKKQYGENFFETTKPILKIYNDTMNYNFEVEINDFANSWYLHINDARCDYRIELGRKPIYSVNDIGGIDYVYISTSNEIEVPNDRILIDKVQNMVYFRNVKTNQISGKSFASLAFLRNMGKIYNIYDLYKELYKDEDLYNPSSRFF